MPLTLTLIYLSQIKYYSFGHRRRCEHAHRSDRRRHHEQARRSGRCCHREGPQESDRLTPYAGTSRTRESHCRSLTFLLPRRRCRRHLLQGWISNVPSQRSSGRLQWRSSATKQVPKRIDLTTKCSTAANRAYASA